MSKIKPLSVDTDRKDKSHLVATNAVDLLNRGQLSPSQDRELQRYIDSNEHLMKWKQLEAANNDKGKESKPAYYGGSYGVDRLKMKRDTMQPPSTRGRSIGPATDTTKIVPDTAGSPIRKVSWKDDKTRRARSESPMDYGRVMLNLDDQVYEDPKAVGDGDGLICRSLRWGRGQRVYTPFDPVPTIRGDRYLDWPDYLYYLEGTYAKPGIRLPSRLDIYGRKSPHQNYQLPSIDTSSSPISARPIGSTDGDYGRAKNPSSVSGHPPKKGVDWNKAAQPQKVPYMCPDRGLQSPDAGYISEPSTTGYSTPYTSLNKGPPEHGSRGATNIGSPTNGPLAFGSSPGPLTYDVSGHSTPSWKIGPYFYTKEMYERDLDDKKQDPDGKESFILNPNDMIRQMASQEVVEKIQHQTVYGRKKAGDDAVVSEEKDSPFEGRFSPFPPYKCKTDFNPWQFVKQVRDDGLTSRQKAANRYQQESVNKNETAVPESMGQLKAMAKQKSSDPKAQHVDQLTGSMMHNLQVGENVADPVWA